MEHQILIHQRTVRPSLIKNGIFQDLLKVYNLLSITSPRSQPGHHPKTPGRTGPTLRSPVPLFVQTSMAFSVPPRARDRNKHNVFKKNTLNPPKYTKAPPASGGSSIPRITSKRQKNDHSTPPSLGRFTPPWFSDSTHIRCSPLLRSRRLRKLEEIQRDLRLPEKHRIGGRGSIRFSEGMGPPARCLVFRGTTPVAG